ncbi:beta-galactosidase [Streptomyces sp. NRRL S-337]|uniref:beta-galactosidase n=1 Tax=Streptomyces sp. NRRL S-337 TaxID=1463900 RepID=UPI0004C98C1A|nr:beta-galactosidase [Streptomyces sp. NRRL S-337]
MGIHFGGDYNPEQWPEEVWAEDLELMKAAHVTMVTAGIFSWAKVEPRPGAWDFGWFDRVMDGLAGAGIAVCLATMTASPPPWLSHAHPEILPEGPDGQRRWPGGRQHYCPSSPVYRTHAVHLVEQLATRYAGHPALAMWHVGNEYGCHTRQCFCDVSAADFRRWLRTRYGSIDALNAAWSTAFWSQGYGDFDEVLPPRTAPTFPNPAQQLDYLRFGDEALRACYLAEKAVLNRLTPGVPVTTNLMPQHKPVDAFAWAPHMDAMALDFYQDPYAADDHVRAGYVFDLMRSARSGQPWLLLEQAPSAVNWRPRNGPKPPGAMRLWSWQAVAQGADAVLFFQWRQSLGGAEKFHSAMVPHGGTGSRIFREITELGRELAAVPGIEGTRSRAEVALLADWHSWWALELDSKPSTALDHSRIALDHYRPLFEAGVACDVLPPQRDLTGYRLVVVPNLYLLTGQDAERLADYVRAGGRLLVSFFSGIVDAHDRVHPGGYPGPLRELLGLHVEEFWPLPTDRSVSVGDGAYTGRADLWSEAINLEGAEALARFTDGDLTGRPAVTRHTYGRGTAWYVATRLAPALLRTLLDDVRSEAGVAPVLPNLPPGVQATVREGADVRYVFLLNHGTEAAEVALPRPFRDALAADGPAVTRVTLAPRNVAVLTERLRFAVPRT